MKTLLKELCQLNGVSGWEDPVRDFIRQQAEDYADSIRTDALGNLIVFKRGRKTTGNKLLLAAHMDEVGMIVSQITDEGFLKFQFAGGVDRRVVLGKPVRVGLSGAAGVIAIKPVHLLTAEERKKVPKTSELYLDIGCTSKEAAESQAALGDPVSFAVEAEEFGTGMLKAKAIDDRAGCAVMLQLLREELPMDVTFAFTVQEETGTKGAFGAGFSISPEIALVLETTTAADCGGVSEHEQVCWAGKGPVISIMDGGTIYDRALFELLRNQAEQNQIPWQTKHYLSGGNDARTFQRTRAGVRTAALSVPVRYLHTPSSVAALSDIEHTLALARAFVKAIAEQEENGIG
ncbi:MAG: M42 family metallopeptidase [Oscillospiraceae bacterium]|nr:M42 family metallopeptidase [Oscillospiraceae bacterium]